MSCQTQLVHWLQDSTDRQQQGQCEQRSCNPNAGERRLQPQPGWRWWPGPGVEPLTGRQSQGDTQNRRAFVPVIVMVIIVTVLFILVMLIILIVVSLTVPMIIAIPQAVVFVSLHGRSNLLYGQTQFLGQPARHAGGPIFGQIGRRIDGKPQGRAGKCPQDTLLPFRVRGIGQGVAISHPLENVFQTGTAQRSLALTRQNNDGDNLGHQQHQNQ
jgi:hypothetical protein